jgi:GNAT superfamily N-acetyltransferase
MPGQPDTGPPNPPPAEIAAGAVVRPATAADIPVILALIRELASFERAADEVVATEADLTESLFGLTAVGYCHLAELDGTVVGFALWFRNLSTWLGRPGIYLEDLYVKPEVRGHGLGKALLMTLVGIARERGYARVEWSVLDWNSTAIEFYRALGAAPRTGWTGWRLTLPGR